MKRLSAAIAIAALTAAVAGALQPGSASAQSATALITTPCVGSSGPCQNDFSPARAGWGALRTGADVVDGIFPLSSWPPADPISGARPANGFFSPSAYILDCSGPYFIQNSPQTNNINARTQQVIGVFPAVQDPICSVTSAPIVDQKFLQQLANAGLQFQVVYPIQDNGNGHAYVVWNNVYPFNFNFHPGANYPNLAGYARLTGATWQNQFQATASGPFGDPAGAFINSLPVGTREITLRLEVPGEAGDTFSIISPTMVIDAWLGETPPPPQIPLSPPSAPPGNNPAGPTNVTTPSSPAGSGTPSGGSDPSNPGSQYSWAAYCNSPNRDGTPRSADFVQSCLATHQH
jgi:hypothetical protein